MSILAGLTIVDLHYYFADHLLLKLMVILK